MTTKYECDITGKQYKQEDSVKEVALFDGNGKWAKFDFGPEATLDEVRDELHDLVDEFKPFHPEWWNNQTDTYEPPRIVNETMRFERVTIEIPKVVKP